MSRYKTLNSGWAPEEDGDVPDSFQLAIATIMHDPFVRERLLPCQVTALIEEIENFGDAPLEGLDDEAIMFDIEGLIYRLKDIIDWDIKVPIPHGNCTLGEIVFRLLMRAVEARRDAFIQKRMFNAVVEDIKSLGIDLN